MLMKKSRKAQIAMFIVIAIILVVVMIFLFANDNFNFSFTKEDRLKGQVKEIVEGCLIDEGRRGVFLLGYQGGYITIPKRIEINPTRYVEYGFKIPNWDRRVNDIPTISSMEGELNSYVKNQTLSCVKRNLKALENDYIYEFTGDVELNSEIQDKNVIFSLVLPMRFNIKNSDEVLSLNDYRVVLEDINLGDLYSLAVEIYNKEGKTNFVEDLVLEQISSASDYSKKESMPSEGAFFSCTPRFWTIPQLKKNLANLNENNFRFLQFEGTYSKEKYRELILNNGVDGEEYYSSSLIGYRQKLDNVKSSYKNYNVNVLFPQTTSFDKVKFGLSDPFRKFEVSPSSSFIVKPIKMNLDIAKGLKFPVPCMQVYHHLYSIDYDLIFKLEDLSSENSGFFFQFPLRVNIENNKPKNAFSPIIPKPETLTFTQEAYCSDESRVYPASVYVRDFKTGEFLDDVNISFECLSVSCDVGKTSKRVINLGGGRQVVNKNSDPILDTKLPYCIGGKIIAEKEGYFVGVSERVDVNDDILKTGNRKSIGVELKKLITFDISANNFKLINKDTSGTLRLPEREEDGIVYILVENKGLKFKSEVIWPTDVEQFNQISFLDDENVEYNVTLIYVDDNYGLRSYHSLENWKPDYLALKSARNVNFVLLASSNEIADDKFVEFFEYSKNILLSGLANPYGEEFGVVFR